MRDLAFYNVGCQDPKGARRIVVPLRRLLRRLLRPIFDRQVAIFGELCDRADRLEHENHALRAQVERFDRRHDALAARMQTTVALGWDYVATVRRLAVLEDRVEALMAARDDARPSIPFAGPGRAGVEVGPEADAAPQARAS